MEEFISLYAEYGAIGVCIILLAFIVIKMSNNLKTLPEIETRLKNTEAMVIALIERWNRSDETRDRRHEDIVNELHDQSDGISFLKGKLDK